VHLENGEIEMANFVRVSQTEFDVPEVDDCWINLDHVVKVGKQPENGLYGLWVVGDDLFEAPRHWTSETLELP
jgi:hypothetical protein